MSTPEIPISNNTYHLSRYINDLIVYRDGSTEKEELFSFENYTKELQEEEDEYHREMESSDDIEVIKEMQENIFSIEKLRSVLKDIWADDEE